MSDKKDSAMNTDAVDFPEFVSIAEMDALRIDVGMAFSASRGVLRTVTIYEPDYSQRKRPPGLIVENLSLEGGDESVPALLRRLADLIESLRSAASSPVCGN